MFGGKNCILLVSCNVYFILLDGIYIVGIVGFVC